MSQVGTPFETVALASDQDRAKRDSRRRQVEGILEAAQHLLPEDRLLLRQVFELGARVGDIARQLRCHRNRIYRRIRSLMHRLRSPLFVYVSRHRDALRPQTRLVAQVVVLQGRSQREAGEVTGMTLHQVRLHLHALATLAGL